MPFVLILIGVLMIVTAANNTHVQMAGQIKSDFNSGFLKWVLAIVIVGAAGYIEDLRGLSRAFMVLIIISIVLSKKGFIANFAQAINLGPAPITPAPEPSTSGSGSGGTNFMVQTPGAPATPVPPPSTGQHSFGDIWSGLWNNIFTSPAN